MAARSHATAMTYALISSLLVNVICGLLWLSAHRESSRADERIEALTGEISKLKNTVAASRKAAEDDTAAAKLVRECQAANADLEQRNLSLSDDMSELKKSLATTLKALDLHLAMSAASEDVTGAKTAQDAEARSLTAEIAELRKAVAASQDDREGSHESREKQLNEIKERNVRLLEKIRKLTAEQDRRPR